VSGFLVAPEPDIPPVPMFGELIGLEVTPKRSGRPPDIARRVAAALAFEVEEIRQGGRNAADAAVAQALAYSSPRKAREARRKPVPEGSLFVVVGEAPESDAAIIAERIHRLATTNEEAHLDCVGWMWRRGQSRASFGRIRAALALSSWAPGARDYLENIPKG
jgi:hypothetical protein